MLIISAGIQVSGLKRYGKSIFFPVFIFGRYQVIYQLYNDILPNKRDGKYR